MLALHTATSITFRNILFLTDFKEESRRALSFAQALAHHCDSHLFPAHVITPFLPSELEAPIADDIMQRLEADKKKDLAGLVRNSGQPSTALTASGCIESAVARWIREHDIDLIVMGTRGRHGIERLLLGSTAEAVVRTATCPVLTIHGEVRPPSARGLDFTHVLFATDLSKSSEPAGSLALSFALEFGARVTLLHVLPPGSRTTSQLVIDSALARHQLLALAPAETARECEIDCVVAEGQPAEQILNLAEEMSVDLVVVGLPPYPHSSTRFRSGVACEVVSSAATAVLTVRGRS